MIICIILLYISVHSDCSPSIITSLLQFPLNSYACALDSLPSCQLKLASGLYPRVCDSKKESN